MAENPEGPEEGSDDPQGDGSEEENDPRPLKKHESVMETLTNEQFLATAQQAIVTITSTIKEVSTTWVTALKEAGVASKNAQKWKNIGGAAVLLLELAIMWGLAHYDSWKSSDLVPLFLPIVGATLVWVRSR
jgi:hypothetical protein